MSVTLKHNWSDCLLYKTKRTEEDMGNKIFWI